MYHNRRRASSGLLEWSMFDHDGSPDICEFDDVPNCSQRSKDELSLTSSWPIDDSCTNKTMVLINETPSASQEIQTDDPGSNTSGNPGADSWGSVFGGGSLTASANHAVTRRKRKIRGVDNTCEIDDVSNDESASPPVRNVFDRRRSFTIDETTDDELTSTPSLSPRKQPLTTASAQCQPMPRADSPRQQPGPNPDPPYYPMRESVLKNGLQESLIKAVQKMDSELALWNCYKANANFPKRLVSGGPPPLTARIVFTEELYGSTYFTCHLVDVESGADTPETLSLVFSSEVSENEKFGRDTVLRVYPPWKEYTVQSEPSRILTAIQFYEVLDKGNSKVK
ncbi:uncharacterized protein ISCGN_030852 [Ixodes scapularis]